MTSIRPPKNWLQYMVQAMNDICKEPDVDQVIDRQPGNGESNQKLTQSRSVTIEEVNRVLEVGRLLFSVLTDDEKAELVQLLNGQFDEIEIGNTGVT